MLYISIKYLLNVAKLTIKNLFGYFAKTKVITIFYERLLTDDIFHLYFN